jgi:hypothetical protein
MRIFAIFDLVGLYRSISSHLFVMKHLSKAKSKGVELVTFYLDPDHDALMIKYDDETVLSINNGSNMLQLFNALTSKTMQLKGKWVLGKAKYESRYETSKKPMTSTFDVVSISVD